MLHASTRIYRNENGSPIMLRLCVCLCVFFNFRFGFAKCVSVEVVLHGHWKQIAHENFIQNIEPRRPLNRMLAIWNKLKLLSIFQLFPFFCAYFLHQCFCDLVFSLFCSNEWKSEANIHQQQQKEKKKQICSTRNTKVESVNFHLLLAQNLWIEWNRKINI